MKEPSLSHIPRKRIAEWIDALRSGEYKQAKARLQRDDGYCCLGVACEIFIPKHKQRRKNGELQGVMPRDQDNAPQWLRSLNKDFVRRFQRSRSDIPTFDSIETLTYGLDYLNDSLNFSFDEIADMVQLVYLENALTLKRNKP